MKIYKGNSFPLTITAAHEDGSQYVFIPNDIIKLGIKKYIGDTKYEYIEEKTISEAISEIDFNISPETTNKLLGKYYIEAKLIYNEGKDSSTLFQEKIEVKGVVIDE